MLPSALSFGYDDFLLEYNMSYDNRRVTDCGQRATQMKIIHGDGTIFLDEPVTIIWDEIISSKC